MTRIFTSALVTPTEVTEPVDRSAGEDEEEASVADSSVERECTHLRHVAATACTLLTAMIALSRGAAVARAASVGTAASR